MHVQPGPAEVPANVDQRVFLHDVSWEEYQAVLAARGESSAVRIAYLEGELELMSPSTDHEILKKTIARLVEAYAEEAGVDLNGIGSVTVKKRRRQRGLEPDECYTIGPVKAVPDLAIEIIWTHGGLDRLDLYRGLGVKEVWMWEQGKIDVFVLRGERWQKRSASRALPGLDLALLAGFVGRPSQTAAVREFRRALRRGGARAR